MDNGSQQKTDTVIRCNFCSRNQSQVKKLIAGRGGVYICDNCIEIAHSMSCSISHPPNRPPKSP